MVNIVDIRDIPGVVVLGPAQVAEVDGEAGDGDHGGADSHQQDGDVGRGVRSEALLSSIPCMSIIEYSRGNGQVSDVTGSAGVTGRYLAKAIISDKSK